MEHERYKNKIGVYYRVEMEQKINRIERETAVSGL